MEEKKEALKILMDGIYEDNICDIVKKTLDFLDTLKKYNVNECDIGVMHALLIACVICVPENYTDLLISKQFLLKAEFVFSEKNVEIARKLLKGKEVEDED